MSPVKGRLLKSFALMLLLLSLGTLLAMTMRRQSAPFDIGDYAADDPAAAAAQFEQSGSDEDLVYLLKVLCYRYRVMNQADAATDIRRYGQQLLDRAKAGKTDLEALDDADGTLLKVLAVVRECGAR